MPRDAVFSIAYMTKPMTTVGLMQLFEQGRVLLGDPVCAHLPAFRDIAVGEIDRDGALRRRQPSRPPTVQDLLRHTSGLTYQNRGTSKIHATYPGSSTVAALALSKPDAIETLANCPLLFDPGAAWEYGFSTDVAGFVLEEITGQSLGEYLSENVWQPLGMSDTSFSLTEKARRNYAHALPNDPLTGAAQTLFHEREEAPQWESGGGGAVSTAVDYLAFAEMLRNGDTLSGQRVLGPKTVRLMISDHLGPGIDNRIADTMDPAAEGYGFGLGFAVRRSNGVSALSGTAGDFYWSGVFGTYFWIDPAEEMSCVIMTASPGDMRLRFRQLSRALIYQAIAS